MAEKPMKRGIYLIADMPLAAHALAVEGGGGDKNLFSEVLAEELTADEVDSLVSDLEESQVKNG